MRSFLILIAALLLSPSVFAQVPSAPLKIVESLKKKDPAVKQLKEWERTRSELEKKKADAQTLFALGKLDQHLFEKKGEREALARALKNYEQVARRFSGDELADDALLALGDLRAAALKDLVAARAAWFEIIDRYPRGNAVKIARTRVNGETWHTLPARKVAETPTPQPKEITAAVVTPAPTPVPTEIPVLLREASTPKPGTGEDLIVKDEIYRRPLIVIDPGHGGEDTGAKGLDGLVEKDLVLEISKDLEELLRERLRAKTFLTRTTDVFIPLADRTRLANDKNADLFISIHLNASEYKTAQGIETYYLDNTKDKASLKLAERENASLQFGDGKTGGDLGFILSDLIQNVKLDDSISLAHHIQDALHGTLSRYYQGVVNLGVKKAPFYVLVGAHMPCVLAEVSFIDHPLEGKRLAEKRYRRLIAQALYEGVRNFFARKEKK
jgi:N-acetylmuramoyl-L-alanine amidase